ncbi:MAG: amino acid adenylation domain-containing protein, partial [bacterium]|nr:amino acid adenylation domain-containing protein [bacterium]
AASSSGLQSLARGHRLTLNTLLQGAWAVLLGRYSGQDDVLFGTTVSGRPAELAGVESIAGLFINTLPVRVQVDSGAMLVPWLGELQARQAELRRYEYSPLDQVQKWSGLPAGQALFDHILVFENYPVSSALRESPPGLEILEAQPSEQTNYPLTVVVLPGSEMELELLYDCRRFDRVAILRMAGHLKNLLRAFVDDPRCRLAELALLTPAERQQLLVEWNVTARDAVRGEGAWARSLHELFEAQVARAPEARAVVCAGESLSYGELNRRANRLAHHLRALGVGPEALVVLRLERSLDPVVAILAVLKAGGAYVPVEHAAPRERLRGLLEDARPAVLITRGEEAGDGTAAGIRVVDLERDREAIARCSPENPVSGIRGEDPAYVIYTSGSTGRPKGVGVTHRNVLRLFTATDEWFGFDRREVWTLFHSFAFDFSVWELWGALLYGGRLVVVPYWISRSPEDFHALVRRERVTVLNQTPSAFYQLIAIDEASGAASRDLALRWIIFGGEALDLGALAPWFHRHGDEDPRLVNMYGITETTVHVTYRPLSAADLVKSGRSPIGAGIPDLGMYLLDSSRNPVPLGVVGEMYVGGAGVARGYLERPALTAERFVPDPYSVAPGERLYRTGDLGRYQPDGDLEFLGRADHQVKIRGFRIEPGEIEAVLADHPAVAAAVVTVRVDEGPVLVAWVGGAEPSRSELRSFLAERLPDYMVPALFVTLDSLPLTPNGKVDRAALARRALPDRIAPEEELVPPRTLAEVTLAGIWSRVLGVERVGVNDNFFELGGDSILSIQVVSRARQEGLVLTPREVFEQPTLGDLAAVVAAAAEGLSDQGPVTGELPLTPAQRWFFEWQLGAPHHFNQALLLEARERLEPAWLERALSVLLEHHDALRLRF